MNPIHKTAFYSSILFIVIFILAMVYNSFTLAQPQIVSNAQIIANQPITSGAYFILVAVLEVLALSVTIILQMKYKILTKLAQWMERKLGSSTWIYIILFLLIALAIIFTFGIIVLMVMLLIGIPTFIFGRRIGEIAVAFIFIQVFMLVILLSLTLIDAIAIILAVLIITDFLLYMKKVKYFFNIFGITSTIIGSIYFGLYLKPIYAIIFIAIFSLYDYIAVFKTKHMQVMAQGALKQKVPAIFIFGNTQEAEQRIEQINSGKPPSPKQQKHTHITRSAILGTGDIIMPSLVISSFVFYQSHFALFMLIGAVIGTWLNSIVLSSGKFKQGIPALPMLALGLLMGGGIGILYTVL